MGKQYVLREMQHTLLALGIALAVAAVAALNDSADFSSVLSVGFAVTLARTTLTVLITTGTRWLSRSKE